MVCKPIRSIKNMIKHTCYDLGKLSGGERVEITLQGNAANLRLFDRKDYQNYLDGKSFKFYGGLATQSPYNMTVPSKGTWYLAIDMQGLQGAVISTVAVYDTKGNAIIPATVVVK